LKDTLTSDRCLILNKLIKVLADPVHGAEIRQDLLNGFNALPAWMQSLLRELPGCDLQTVSTAILQSPVDEKPPSARHRSVKSGEVR
jgi:hypothetical protein